MTLLLLILVFVIVVIFIAQILGPGCGILIALIGGIVYFSVLDIRARWAERERERGCGGSCDAGTEAS